MQDLASKFQRREAFTTAKSAGQVGHWPTSGLFAPDRRLGPAQFRELGGAQRRFANREKFVELRRLDTGAAQHGVSLAAVMNVVLEQMHQQAVAALLLHPRAAMDANDLLREVVLAQPVAEGDQAVVDRALRPRQLGHGAARLFIGPGGRTQRAALQRVDIEMIDDEDVVQRCLDRGEEARALRLEFALREFCAGRQQAMVGPRVVVGKCAHALEMRSRHVALLASWSRSAPVVSGTNGELLCHPRHQLCPIARAVSTQITRSSPEMAAAVSAMSERCGPSGVKPPSAFLEFAGELITNRRRRARLRRIGSRAALQQRELPTRRLRIFVEFEGPPKLRDGLVAAAGG